MKTVTEIEKNYYDNGGYGSGLYDGYKTAIEGILKDIQESSTISVESIEKYLQDLLK